MEVFGLDTRRSTMQVRRLIGHVPQHLSIDSQLTATRTSGCSPGSTTCPAADLVDGARLDLLPSDDIRADNHRPDHH
jgi:hypothetical protein